MSIKTSSLIKWIWICLLVLSFVSLLHAADDTRFTLKDGVIYDSELGLQWAPAPDVVMNHYMAEEYAGNLSLAGGGWRLPTRTELKSLYDGSYPGDADPRFRVGGMWVWTSDLYGYDPSLAWGFDFGIGLEGRGYRAGSTECDRVLAVRFRR